MTPEEADALAADYVMGLLDEAERARCDVLLDSDRVFGSRVAEWRTRMRELDETAPPQATGESLWRRIESSLEGARQQRQVPSAPVRETRAGGSLLDRVWGSLTVWRGVGLAASAAALLLAIGLGLVLRESARQPVFVAVMVDSALRPQAVVNAFADGRTELVPLQPVTVPQGRTLQVWTLWDRERGPVSLGLLDRMRAAVFPGGGLPPPRADQLFEVTLEPAGGSPTGRPTGPILMKGTADRTL